MHGIDGRGLTGSHLHNPFFVSTLILGLRFQKLRGTVHKCGDSRIDLHHGLEKIKWGQYGWLSVFLGGTRESMTGQWRKEDSPQPMKTIRPK
jgi:hypothetical protein